MITIAQRTPTLPLATNWRSYQCRENKDKEPTWCQTLPLFTESTERNEQPRGVRDKFVYWRRYDVRDTSLHCWTCREIFVHPLEWMKDTHRCGKHRWFWPSC